MSKRTFIPLSEYAYRYQVSLGLLKRKIQLKQVEFVFANGEYLIKNQPFEEPDIINDTHRPQMTIDPETQLKEVRFQLEKKKIELEKLRSEYEDLKNVFHFLEKENAQMKNIILGIQRMDDFLNKKNFSFSLENSYPLQEK